MPKAGIKLSGSGQKQLQALANRLVNIDKVRRQIAAAQSEEALDLINEGFRREADPYGKRWRKRKKETRFSRGRKVLSGRTSRLQRGWKRTRLGINGFTVTASVNYALPHQKPRRRKRPQRAMVPIDGKGFPSRWRKPLNDVASDVMTDFLTGK